MTLDDWGPRHIFPHILRYTQSNWGEHPMTMDEATRSELRHVNEPRVEAVFQGRTLQQVLEGISFWFTIDGCSRATTHQIVRSRFAAFMQHGGRDNDWRHRAWTMPETIARTIDAEEEQTADHVEAVDMPPPLILKDGRHTCITDWKPIEQLIQGHETADTLKEVIDALLFDAHYIYAKLVDAGIPWQDARRLLPIGTQTYIHAVYNYVSLRDMLGNRLEHIMDWEINCVAQLMLREIKLNCPPVLYNGLGSRSDREQRAAFAGLESWPPDGKYPVPPELEDLPREHRPEQNPFWVLHPDSFAGGPVRWIPTNGRYPHEILNEYFQNNPSHRR